MKTAIKNRVEMDVNNGLNQLACVNSNNDAEEEDLNNKILFMKNKVKNACDKKNIPFPKMMYFILWLVAIIRCVK